MSVRARVTVTVLLVSAAAALVAGVFQAAGGDDRWVPLVMLGVVLSTGAGALVRYEHMRRRLESSLSELQLSRKELSDSLKSLGDALGSTHDLTSLLRVVLETATKAMKAKSGAVYLVTPARNELTVRCAHALDQSFASHRIRVGEGIAGRVAETRKPLLTPSDVIAPAPTEAEPNASTVIAVPLESATQLIGVLALYDRDISEPFSAVDLDTVSSLAQQAAVGVENVLLHQEAQRLSITDGLTQVWNSRYLTMRFGQEVERSIRFRRPLSIALLDVDFFKTINDRYGHQRGDAVLIELAQRVVRAVRGQVDTLARLGGEEFVLILPETGAEGARIVCQKILEAISSEPFGTDGEDQISVTVSIGCATFPQHGPTQQSLLRAADFAMYEAKARGRNRVVLADELDNTPSGAGLVVPPSETPVDAGSAEGFQTPRGE